MEAYGKQEVYVYDDFVAPGYLYDKTNEKCLQRDDGLNFEVKEAPVRFEIEIERFSALLELLDHDVKSSWMTDFHNENPTEAILLRGGKVLERVGNNIPLHESKHTVTSVICKSYTDMLLIFKCELEVECINKFKTYIQDVLHGNSECFIPTGLLKNSKKAFIYSYASSYRKEVTPTKHSFEEFCRILKDSKVSSIPLRANISGPTSSPTTTTDVHRSKDDEPPVMEGSLSPKRTSDDSQNNPSVQRGVTEENEKEVKRSNKYEAGEVQAISENTRQKNIGSQGLSNALGYKEHHTVTEQDRSVQEKYPIYKVEDNLIQKKDVEENNFLQDTSNSEQRAHGCSSRKRQQILNSNSTSNPPKKPNSNVLDEQHSSEYNVDQVQINENLHETHKTQKAKYEQQREKEQKNSMKSTYLNPTKTTINPCGIEQKIYGEINENVSPKSIIFLGASGSGKTMLINFIANFHLGKKKADDDLIHVESTSQTTSITAYTFYSNESETALTVIDTLGLNDSSGAEVRDHVQTLKTFLANVSSKGFDIHAIGFVVQAHLVRLTSSERLVMDYVSTIFGQRVSEHLLTLVTFADNQDTPPVIEALDHHGVKFKLFMKFNNSTLSNTKTDEIDDLDRAYWRVCWKNWKKCMKILNNLPPLSVNTMKAVQNEVYANTVNESAEKELFGELYNFMSACKKEKGISKTALQSCEQIWELVAVSHQMKHKLLGEAITRDDILINFAVDVCRKLNIPSDWYICLLSLAPTGRLVISGSEIIRTMELLITKGQSNSERMCKSLAEWSFCKKCKEEHEMEKMIYEKGYFLKKFPGPNILCLRCRRCKCDADVHIEIPKQSPFGPNTLLKHTMKCIRDALGKYSLPGFVVPEKIFLMHLDEHLEYKYSQLIEELRKM